MTDNEIVVALRAVAKRYEGKPLRTFETNINAMATDAANHIERLSEENNFLKAEIERLTKENDELKNGFFQEHYKENECQELLSVKEAWRKESLHHIDLEAEIEALKHYCNECLKDLKNAHAEIERLKGIINTDVVFVGRRQGKTQEFNRLLRLRVAEIKSEARKEFVEKLKVELTDKKYKYVTETNYSKTINSVIDSCVGSIDNLLGEMEKDT